MELVRGWEASSAGPADRTGESTALGWLEVFSSGNSLKGRERAISRGHAWPSWWHSLIEMLLRELLRLQYPWKMMAEMKR